MTHGGGSDCGNGAILEECLEEKQHAFHDIVKIGRTHLMDATPISLGQEFSAFGAQIENGIKSLENSIKRFLEIPIGGTAVGTGLNTPKNYDKIMCKNISKFIGIEFFPSKNTCFSIILAPKTEAAILVPIVFVWSE